MNPIFATSSSNKNELYQDDEPMEYEASESGNLGQESDYEMSVASHGHPPTVSTLGPEDSVSNRGDPVPIGKALARRDNMSASDAESVVSFHSSVDGYLFKDLHGRAFSNQSDLYLLPADDTEHERLDVQHTVLRLHHNGLYVSKELVEHALRPNQEPPAAALDIGTGSGKWALELASQFPWVEVVGMDLVPPAALHTIRLPDNLRFEVDDANLPMDHYYNAFNVVHCRSCDGGIIDLQNFLYEIARTLRPCGVLLLIGGDTQTYGEDFQPLPTRLLGEPGFSWVQFMFASSLSIHRSRGNFALEAAPKWTGWLERNPNYEDVKTEYFYIPLGPWKSNMSAREVVVSELMADDMVRIMHAFRPLLLAGGMKAADVQLGTDNAIREIRELGVHAYIRWRYTTAIRTELTWQERPEEPLPI